MPDKFLESIKTGFIRQIEEIINETKQIAEKDNLNAIDTLVLVNNNISSWISSINGTIHIDDELLTKVANLKRNFVSEAKKEVAIEVSKIIENESSNVTSKISDFMNELKKKGIDLDGDSKQEQKKEEKSLSKQPRRSEESSINLERVFGEEPSFISDGLFEEEEPSIISERLFGRARTLKRELEPPRRSTSNDCPPDNCGQVSSGCGC